MNLETFIAYQPRGDTVAVIEQANKIIDEYVEQGFTLTLRQLYYQFVARGLLENTPQQYKRLGVIIRDARNGGMVRWDAIEDRTREVHTHSAWDSPADIIKSAAGGYRIDPWLDQLYRPEVWIEKDALLGVIEDICANFRVPYFAHRGNNSQTLQYEAGKRFESFFDHGLIPLILHLADHDPNGIDMTRDNRDRLSLYAGEPVEVRRIGLNMDQVRRYRPPPNFAKESDTRSAGYMKTFGTDKCWELDALSPVVIAALIRDAIEPLIDQRKWEASLKREQRGRNQLRAVASNWATVEKSVSRRRSRSR